MTSVGVEILSRDNCFQIYFEMYAEKGTEMASHIMHRYYYWYEFLSSFFLCIQVLSGFLGSRPVSIRVENITKKTIYANLFQEISRRSVIYYSAFV